MQAILIYLLKTTIISGILFLYYHLALRNKRFHYYNRFYLLMSVALSLLLPLLNIELWQFNSNNKQVINLMNVVAVNNTEIEATGTAPLFTWSNGILLLYIAITIALLLIFIAGLVKLYRYRRIYPAEKLGNILFINTNLQQAPFSFFNNLFWRDTLDISDATGQQIFKHELTHIEQKHSWDKVFLRLTTLVLWMNPFYWLIQKELSLIHEFIADEKAIENRSAEAFALLLLQSQYGKNIFSPAQSFNYSPIKRRLFMLTTTKRTRLMYARKFMAIPVAASVLFLFSCKQDQVQPLPDAASKNSVGKMPEQVDVTNGTGQLIQASFPGGADAWAKYLQRSLKSDVPTNHHAPTGMYTTVVSFKVDENGKVSDVKAENDPGYGTAEEAVRAIKEGPNWIPATRNGAKISFVQKQAITFVVEEGN